jgi:hypothetical protein
MGVNILNNVIVHHISITYVCNISRIPAVYIYIHIYHMYIHIPIYIHLHAPKGFKGIILFSSTMIVVIFHISITYVCNIRRIPAVYIYIYIIIHTYIHTCTCTTRFQRIHIIFINNDGSDSSQTER